MISLNIVVTVYFTITKLKYNKLVGHFKISILKLKAIKISKLFNNAIFSLEKRRKII